MKLFVGLALVLLSLDAGALNALDPWGPTWSELSGQLWSRTYINRTPAIIKRVDDRDWLQRKVKSEPGKRRVVVQSPQRKGFDGTDIVLDMDLEPCQRYYVNAQFENGVGTKWTPVVAWVEPIAGCKLPESK